MTQKKTIRHITGTTHTERSNSTAASGKYEVVSPKTSQTRASETLRPKGSPDVFFDKFTSHPVVDEVMRRLSK